MYFLRSYRIKEIKLMKKLVNTVAGTALIASMIAGCGANEHAAAPIPEETTVPVETTIPAETTESTTKANIEDTTNAATETTTIPEEDTVPEEETSSFTEPNVTVTTIIEETEDNTPEILPCPDEYCPNATDWA